VQEAHNLLVEKVLKVNKVLGRALKFRKLGVSIGGDFSIAIGGS